MTDVDDDEVTLTVAPPLQAGQRVTVVLGRLEGGAPDDPSAPDPGPAAGRRRRAGRRSSLPREEIPEGRWLVRVQVDGVDSLPEIVGETYGAPDLTLPPP